MEAKESLIQEERIIHALNGFLMLFVSTVVLIAGTALFIAGPVFYSMDRVSGGLCGVLVTLGIILFVVAIILYCGLKILNPNEALVFALFGKYYGTIKKSGYYWVNPFCSAINPTGNKAGFTVSSGGRTSVTPAAKKISLKTMTLDNAKQKVNDELGNPVEIGAIVIWKVVNPTQAVINVENYKNYLSIQCDAIIRNTARMYPYDTSEKGDEKSLRGSSQEIADIMQLELQEKVKDAGIQIIDVRITHLAYAPEIASAMLQRQQAAAIIESAVVQRPHALGQRDLLHKISAKRVQRRAVCALRAPERAAFRLPSGGKTVWPDLGHRPPGHRGGHGGAGGIPKHPQHAGPRCGRGPQYADARLQNFFARLSQQLFTTPLL